LKDDHQGNVFSVIVNAKLRIFASAEREGLIKFWDDQNTLVCVFLFLFFLNLKLRSVDLHANIDSLAFLSDMAHVLIGTRVRFLYRRFKVTAQNHISILRSQDYLPSLFAKRLTTFDVSLHRFLTFVIRSQIVADTEEEPFEFDESHMNKVEESFETALNKSSSNRYASIRLDALSCSWLCCVLLCFFVVLL
jgi:hypothetical protein